MNWSLPAPSKARSSAAAAGDHIVAVSAQEDIGTALPMIVSFPAPASIVSWITPAGRVAASDQIIAAEAY